MCHIPVDIVMDGDPTDIHTLPYGQVVCYREVRTLANRQIQMTFHLGKVHRGVLQIAGEQYPLTLRFQQEAIGGNMVLGGDGGDLQSAIVKITPLWIFTKGSAFMVTPVCCRYEWISSRMVSSGRAITGSGVL